MTKLPHTAISSCSGYIYQGKIAVMHCLRLFEELGEDARHLSLGIERLDDFVILNADNSHKSMHQVKANKGSSFSGYKKAIKKQIKDSKTHPDIETYFHVATHIEDIPSDFSEAYDPVEFYLYKDENEVESKACELNKVDSYNECQANVVVQ